MNVNKIAFVLIFSAFQALGQAVKSDAANRTKPFVLGVIDEIRSEILSENRILNIYLPEGYAP